VFHSCQVNRLG